MDKQEKALKQIQEMLAKDRPKSALGARSTSGIRVFDGVPSQNKRYTEDMIPADLYTPGARYTVNNLDYHGQLPEPEKIIRDTAFVDECIEFAQSKNPTKAQIDYIG